MSDRQGAVTVIPAAQPTQTLAVRQQESLSVRDVVANVVKVREVLDTVMKPSVHYGKVPGTDRMSLWQPGAEVLMLTFRLRPDLRVEDLSTDDEVRYRVAVDLIHIPSGEIVGTGLGEASTNEGKYRWRKAVCKEEFEATPPERRRVKYGAGKGGGHYTQQQIRTDPADLANTVLKMATKRGIVGAVRSATAASDVFDQDLEELKEAGIELDNEGKPTVEQPKAKPAAAPSSPAAQPAQTATTAPPADKPAEGETPSAGDRTALAYGLSVPEEAWQEVRNIWHNRGTISEKQQQRLSGIAKGNGWTSEQVSALLHDRFGGGADTIPTMSAYDKVVKIFESFKPA